jgi:hypothetical protein
MDLVTNVALFKSGFDSIKTYIQNAGAQANQPGVILDPLSTLIRISLLSFFAAGTKISVGNNTIVYQAPGMLQGATRWTTGSTRTELHLLLKPIIRALKHYDRDSKHIQKITRLATKGLKKLKTAYQNDNNITLYSLNFYIHTIENSEKDRDLLNVLEMKDDLNVFEGLWTEDDIAALSHLLTKVIQHREYQTRIDHLVQAIIHILEVKDEQVRDIIQNTTSKI